MNEFQPQQTTESYFSLQYTWDLNQSNQDLPSTLIRHENRGFSKSLSKPEKSENAGHSLRVDGKHFETGTFRKRWRHDTDMISLIEFPQTRSEMTNDCCVFNFLLA